MYSLKEALLKEMKLDPPESDAHIQRDPFILLGYGVNAYFDILYYLCCCFVFVTIFSLPIYSLYSNEIGFSDQGISRHLSRYSLGNLGGSSMACAQNRLGRRQIGLICPVDTYLDPQHAVMGVISASSQSKKYCH